MNRKKIIFSALAVLLGLIAAFGFKPLQVGNIWAVQTSDAIYFYIEEELNGEAQGVHYTCLLNDPNETCTISTPINIGPDAQGRIIRAQATIVIDNAKFEDLDPNQ